MARDKKTTAAIVSTVDHSATFVAAGMARAQFVPETPQSNGAAVSKSSVSETPETPEKWSFEAGQTDAEAHLISKTIEMFGIPACTPTRAILLDTADMPLTYAACAYCADGTIRPADAPRAIKAPRAARTPRAPKAERVLTSDELRAAEYDRAIAERNLFSYNATLARKAELQPAWDAVNRRLAELTKLVGRASRSTGTTGTGTHSPRRNYGASVKVATDSHELATIREYATLADDKRALELVTHVDAFRAAGANGSDVVCPHCNSAKHLRPTGFFSASREIEKMADRLAKTGKAIDDLRTADDDAPTLSLVDDTDDDVDVGDDDLTDDDSQELPAELADAVLAA